MRKRADQCAQAKSTKPELDVGRKMYPHEVHLGDLLDVGGEVEALGEAGVLAQPCSAFRVSAFGFSVQRPAFRVSALGFGAWGLGSGVWGLGFGVWGLGFGVWGLGFRVQSSRFRV